MKQLLAAIGLSLTLMSGTVIAEETSGTAATTTTATTADTASASTVTPADEPDQAAAVAENETLAEADKAKLDSGNTSWLLASTLLVLMMTLPGLALFYGGMVRKKNVLATMMHSLTSVAIISVVWVIVGYTLAFGGGEGGVYKFVGELDKLMLHGIKVDTLSGTIPENLFVMFQMTFAIITVAIMAGAFAERIKYSAFVIFATLWVILVYSPICHWVWAPSGWLFAKGAMDFAGGTVVHINAGIAGLVGAYVVGKRLGLGREPMAPHNLVLTLLGAGLIWVGWFGFNAGSALSAGNNAALAMLVTQVAAASACLSWLATERLARGRASLLGGASGAVSGLVAITPAAGFVTVDGAIAIGIISGIVCFWGTNGLKKMLGIDDSLDAFGLHGIGGIVGAILTAVFVNPEVIGKTSADMPPMLERIWIQLEGVIATILYSGIVSYILLMAIDKTVGLRVSEEHEREGLDLALHGERVE